MARFFARNFQCTDENCGKQKNDKYKWDDDLKPEVCECGTEMLEIPKEAIDSPAYLRFSSLTNEEKSKMLKARSHDHFNREIKERKHEMLRETKRDFFNN